MGAARCATVGDLDAVVGILDELFWDPVVLVAKQDDRPGACRPQAWQRRGALDELTATIRQPAARWSSIQPCLLLPSQSMRGRRLRRSVSPTGECLAVVVGVGDRDARADASEVPRSVPR